MPQQKAAPGQTIEGRFLLLEEIGQGGMSTVFKARDLQAGGSGRTVAVKVPLPQYSSGVGSWSMAQREAEIGAALQHPSVVRFIRVEQQDRRRVPLVVTEFVDGTTLSRRLRDAGRLREDEAIDLARRVCDAIEYVHERGYVHYDLKPANVILCDDGSIRIIDFGAAHARARGRFTFAGPGPSVATAQYVAPEQIDRRRGQPSVDVYAIGAILYEMLTGHAPFENDDPFVVASARQIGDPTAPRRLEPSISRQVEEIVLRALRRNPAERYASVAELAEDLRDPSRVQVTGLADRLVPVTPGRKRLRLARYVAVVGVAPLVILAAGFRLLWWWFEHKH
jgi:serine/threonine-protein kinase